MSYLKTIISLIVEALGYKNFSLIQRLNIFKNLFFLYYKSKTRKKGVEVIKVSINGFQIFAYDYTTLISLYRDVFLKLIYFFKSASLKPTIIDCGANIGISILYFKHLYPNAEIWAFEVNPSALKLLYKNIEENNLENIHVFEFALTDLDGEIPFCIPIDNGSLNGSIIQNYSQGEYINVKTKCLSNYIINKQIDFAKIDIEGAENLVIKDLFETNSLKNINEYTIEYHYFYKQDIEMETFLNYFSESNFTFLEITNDETFGGDKNIIMNFKL